MMPHEEARMVGVVVVSHSVQIALGVAELAGQMAGPAVAVEPAGGTGDGGLGTDEGRVRAAIARADRGRGVVVLGDLGSSILTVRHLLDDRAGATGDGNRHVRLADAPLVEGALAAAVAASAGVGLEEVVLAAEEARGVHKL
jgi:phosphoenolpyruvate---glycerone phosphotransferase subunit DhaM